MSLQQLQHSTAAHDVRQLAGHTAGDVVVLEARNLDDAEAAITAVRRNAIVVLRCHRLDSRLAQRLIDTVSGGVCAIDGQTRCISSQVVLFMPAAARFDDSVEAGGTAAATGR